MPPGALRDGQLAVAVPVFVAQLVLLLAALHGPCRCAACSSLGSWLQLHRVSVRKLQVCVEASVEIDLCATAVVDQQSWVSSDTSSVA